MWTTVYVATGYEQSKHIVDKLTGEGFLVKSRYYAEDGKYELYEILALMSESKEVQLAMIELGII